jgi:hypothetical protein
VYFSEPHEIRAMVQEMYVFREKYPLEKMMEHHYYTSAQEMEKFNAEEKFQEIMDYIEDYNPDKFIPIMVSLWKWFMDNYYGVLKSQKKKPRKKIELSASIYDIMKDLQPRINNAGKTLKRKLVNLYSIEPFED